MSNVLLMTLFSGSRSLYWSICACTLVHVVLQCRINPQEICKKVEKILLIFTQICAQLGLTSSRAEQIHLDPQMCAFQNDISQYKSSLISLFYAPEVRINTESPALKVRLRL